MAIARSWVKKSLAVFVLHCGKVDCVQSTLEKMKYKKKRKKKRKKEKRA